MTPEGGQRTFDREALLERLDGDLRLARELISTYLEEGPALRAGLRGAVASNRPTDLERAAHSLRGALAAISAPQAARLAHRLETDAREGDLPTRQDRVAELEDELDLLEQNLRTYLTEAR